MKMQSIVKSGLMAAIVALSGIAQPASAQEKLRVQQFQPLPQLGPQVLIPGVGADPIEYPNCPSGFSLSQRGAHIFTCRRPVSPIAAAAAVQTAEATPCSPWAGSPDVYSAAYNGTLHVYFKCHN